MNDTAWNKIKTRIEQPDCQMGDVKYPLGEPFFVTPSDDIAAAIAYIQKSCAYTMTENEDGSFTHEYKSKTHDLPHLTRGPSYDVEDADIVFGERVFAIERTENGYKVTEACDGYYNVELSADELIAHFEAIIEWVREND